MHNNTTIKIKINDKINNEQTNRNDHCRQYCDCLFSDRGVKMAPLFMGDWGKWGIVGLKNSQSADKKIPLIFLYRIKGQ